MTKISVCPRCGMGVTDPPATGFGPTRFHCGTWVSMTGIMATSFLCDKRCLIRSLYHVIPVLERMEQSMSKPLSVVDVKELTWAIKTLKESIQKVT